MPDDSNLSSMLQALLRPAIIITRVGLDLKLVREFEVENDEIVFGGVKSNVLYSFQIARENGNMYIYSVPELHLVYMVKKISHLPDVATDQPYVEDEPIVAEGGDAMSGTLTDTFAAKPEEVIMELVSSLDFLLSSSIALNKEVW